MKRSLSDQTTITLTRLLGGPPGPVPTAFHAVTGEPREDIDLTFKEHDIATRRLKAWRKGCALLGLGIIGAIIVLISFIQDTDQRYNAILALLGSILTGLIIGWLFLSIQKANENEERWLNDVLKLLSEPAETRSQLIVKLNQAVHQLKQDQARYLANRSTDGLANDTYTNDTYTHDTANNSTPEK